MGSTRPSARTARAIALGIALPLVACSPGGEEAPTGLPGIADGGSVLFFTQNATPGLQMEALYRGPVTLDGAGCLRLRFAEGPTAIWPEGFRLAREDAGLLVLDADGRSVGRIGGEFQFSGGTVASLHAGLPVSPEVRAEAQERCPGRYWVVGGILPED